MTTATRTHVEMLSQRITNEKTSGIDREKALKLKEIVYWASDGHTSTGWNKLQRKIHSAGFSTIVFPMADGRSYTRNTKNFKMYWAMVDRGSANYLSMTQSKLISDHPADEPAKQIMPIYCYDSLTPVQFYVRDWVSMNLEDAGYVTDASSIKSLLAKQTKHSRSEGWGQSAAENYSFWVDDFNNEWPEGTDRVIKPSLSLPIKRLKFNLVCLQPETELWHQAWDKDEAIKATTTPS